MLLMTRTEGKDDLAELRPGITLREARVVLARVLRARGVETPALDARILVQEATNISHAHLIARGEEPLGTDEVARLEAFARRRLAGEPVSRILGRRAFFGRTFEITPDVLDPRPETELLVEAALRLRPHIERMQGDSGIPVACDLGTGSGAIIIALLAEWPGLRGVAVDISAPALAVARRNAAAHGVLDRLVCVRSHWLEAIGGPVDLLLANPPYIARADIATLQTEVRKHDPHLALDGGADGLDAYRAIAARAGRVLRPGGWLLVEVGAGQGQAVRELFLQAGLMAEEEVMPSILCDLAGVERVVALKGNI